jgi:hypothetical protein
MHSHDADRATSCVASAGDDPRTAARLRLLGGEEKGSSPWGLGEMRNDGWTTAWSSRGLPGRFGRLERLQVVDTDGGVLRVGDSSSSAEASTSATTGAWGRRAENEGVDAGSSAPEASLVVRWSWWCSRARARTATSSAQAQAQTDSDDGDEVKAH